MRLIFFFNSRFFSSSFTALSSSNLMLMALGLGLSTLAFPDAHGTLNCLHLQATSWPDMAPPPWSIGIYWSAPPTPILWPSLYSCMISLELRHPSVSVFPGYLVTKFQLITTPHWRAQVPGMGCPWMKVGITSGLLSSRTEVSTSPSEILLVHLILDAMIKANKNLF
jgi:hypothetical protein